MEFFVPFIDGALVYNCSSCSKGVCCRDWDILTATKQEYALLVKEFPSIASFSTPLESSKSAKRSGLMRIYKWSGCWFHGTDGYCRIHKKYGIGRKPLICRLYPYHTHYICQGEFIVCPQIDVARGECLVVADTFVGKNSMSDERRSLLRDSKKLIGVKAFEDVIPWSKQRYALEKRIFEVSKMYLGRSNYLDFAVQQYQALDEDLDTADIRAQLEQKVRLWKDFLLLEGLDIENKKVTHELTVLTSILRIKAWDVHETIVPLQLLALYLSMVLSYSYTKKPVLASYYYMTLKHFAHNLVFLEDTPEIKRRLLHYAGVQKKQPALNKKDMPLPELATALRLRREERLKFVTMLWNKGTK